MLAHMDSQWEARRQRATLAAWKPHQLFLVDSPLAFVNSSSTVFVILASQPAPAGLRLRAPSPVVRLSIAEPQPRGAMQASLFDVDGEEGQEEWHEPDEGLGGLLRGVSRATGTGAVRHWQARLGGLGPARRLGFGQSFYRRRHFCSCAHPPPTARPAPCLHLSPLCSRLVPIPCPRLLTPASRSFPRTFSPCRWTATKS